MTRAKSMQESYLPAADPAAEWAVEELHQLPVGDVIALAEDAGIILAAEGDELRVRGPRHVEALGRLLLARKPEVLAALCARSRSADVTQTDGQCSDDTPRLKARASPDEEPKPETVRLEEALQRHDWFYSFSDSVGTRQRGEESERRLLGLAAQLSPVVVQSLWQRYYPTGRPGHPPCPVAAVQESSGPEAVGETAPILKWDADRAAAVVTEVEKRIDTAMSASHIVCNPARRKILAHERALVRRFAAQAAEQLWAWPQALEILLARWKEWDDGRGV